MARLIDADTLLETSDVFILHTKEYGSIDVISVDAVGDAHTVDAVPVVRCKDCIYTRKVYGRLVCKYGTCTGCILREDFFCANGTRKEGDKDA